MNFLQLVNQARVECGVTASPLSTTVGVNPVSEAGRFIGWVRDAWRDIQLKRPDWKFMQGEFGFNTVGGAREFLPILGVPDGSFGDWMPETFRIYNSSFNAVFSTTVYGGAATVNAILTGATSGATGTIMALGASVVGATQGQYVALKAFTGYFTPGEALMVGATQVGTFTQTSNVNLTIADIAFFNALAGGNLQSGEMYLSQWDWPLYRDVYLFGGNASLQGYGRSIAFAVRPETMALNVAMTPDNAYYVYGRYRKKTVAMGTGANPDFDVPSAPVGTGTSATVNPGQIPSFEEFHMLVVYAAMKKYAAYESASEIMTRANQEFNPMYSRLVDRWTETPSLGDAIA